MGLLDKSLVRAREAVKEAKRQAVEQGWDAERTQQEKQRLELLHDVSFCDGTGCLELVTEAAGYRGVFCDTCQPKDEG